jgi:hypothetical protein
MFILRVPVPATRTIAALRQFLDSLAPFDEINTMMQDGYAYLTFAGKYPMQEEAENLLRAANLQFDTFDESLIAQAQEMKKSLPDLDDFEALNLALHAYQNW